MGDGLYVVKSVLRFVRFVSTVVVWQCTITLWCPMSGDLLLSGSCVSSLSNVRLLCLGLSFLSSVSMMSTCVVSYVFLLSSICVCCVSACVSVSCVGWLSVCSVCVVLACLVLLVCSVLMNCVSVVVAGVSALVSACAVNVRFGFGSLSVVLVTLKSCLCVAGLSVGKLLSG